MQIEVQEQRSGDAATVDDGQGQAVANSSSVTPKYKKNQNKPSSRQTSSMPRSSLRQSEAASPRARVNRVKFVLDNELQSNEEVKEMNRSAGNVGVLKHGLPFDHEQIGNGEHDNNSLENLKLKPIMTKSPAAVIVEQNETGFDSARTRSRGQSPQSTSDGPRDDPPRQNSKTQVEQVIGADEIEMGSLAEQEGRCPSMDLQKKVLLGASAEEGDLGHPGSDAAKSSRWTSEGLGRSNEDDPYHEAVSSSQLLQGAAVQSGSGQGAQIASDDAQHSSVSVYPVNSAAMVQQAILKSQKAKITIKPKPGKDVDEILGQRRPSSSAGSAGGQESGLVECSQCSEDGKYLIKYDELVKHKAETHNIDLDELLGQRQEATSSEVQPQLSEHCSFPSQDGKAQAPERAVQHVPEARRGPQSSVKALRISQTGQNNHDDADGHVEGSNHAHQGIRYDEIIKHEIEKHNENIDELFGQREQPQYPKNTRLGNGSPCSSRHHEVDSQDQKTVTAQLDLEAPSKAQVEFNLTQQPLTASARKQNQFDMFASDYQREYQQSQASAKLISSPIQARDVDDQNLVLQFRAYNSTKRGTEADGANFQQHNSETWHVQGSEDQAPSATNIQVRESNLNIANAKVAFEVEGISTSQTPLDQAREADDNNMLVSFTQPVHPSTAAAPSPVKISDPNTINHLSKVPDTSAHHFDSRAIRIDATKSEQQADDLNSYQNTTSEDDEGTALDASQTQNTAINQISNSSYKKRKLKKLRTQQQSDLAHHIKEQQKKVLESLGAGAQGLDKMSEILDQSIAQKQSFKKLFAYLEEIQKIKRQHGSENLSRFIPNYPDESVLATFNDEFKVFQDLPENVKKQVLGECVPMRFQLQDRILKIDVQTNVEISEKSKDGELDLETGMFMVCQGEVLLLKNQRIYEQFLTSENKFKEERQYKTSVAESDSYGALAKIGWVLTTYILDQPQMMSIISRKIEERKKKDLLGKFEKDSAGKQTISKGDSFGDFSQIKTRKYKPQYAIAISPETQILYLSQHSLRKILTVDPDNMKFVKDKIPQIAFQSGIIQQKIVRCFEDVAFVPGQTVFKAGEHTNFIYLIKSGTVQIQEVMHLKKGQQTSSMNITVMEIQDGEWFGEEFLLQETFQTASYAEQYETGFYTQTVEARTNVKALRINRLDFKKRISREYLKQLKNQAQEKLDFIQKRFDIVKTHILDLKYLDSIKRHFDDKYQNIKSLYPYATSTMINKMGYGDGKERKRHFARNENAINLGEISAVEANTSHYGQLQVFDQNSMKKVQDFKMIISEQTLADEKAQKEQYVKIKGEIERLQHLRELGRKLKRKQEERENYRERKEKKEKDYEEQRMYDDYHAVEKPHIHAQKAAQKDSGAAQVKQLKAGSTQETLKSIESQEGAHKAQLVRKHLRCEQHDRIQTTEYMDMQDTEEVESLSSKYKSFQPFQVVGKESLADRQLHVAHTKLKTTKRNQIGIITQMSSCQNTNANHAGVGYLPTYQDMPKEKADSEHKIINFADEPGQRPWSRSDDEDELDKVLKQSTARQADGLAGSDVQQLRKKQTEKIQIDKAEGKAQAHGGQQLWRSSMDVAHSPNDSLDYQNYYNLDFPKNSPSNIEDFDKKKQERDHGNSEALKVLNDQQKAILSSKASTRMAPWDPNTGVGSQNQQKKDNKQQAPGAAESFEGIPPSRQGSPLTKHRVSAIPTFQTPKDLKDIDRFLDRDINKAERLFRQSLEKRYGEANQKKQPIRTSKNRPRLPEASLLSQLETEESDLDQSKRYSKAHIQKRKMRKLMQQRSGFDEEYKPQEKQGLLLQRFGKLTRKDDRYYEASDSTRANMSKQLRLKIQDESHGRAQSQPSNVSHARYNSTSMSQRLNRRSLDFNASSKFSQLPQRKLVFADESCGELPKLSFKEDLPGSPQGQLVRLNKSEIHKSPSKKKPKQLTFLDEHQKPRGTSDYGHFNLPSSTSSSASALHVDFGQLFKNERFKSVERSQPTSFATTQYIQPSSSLHRKQHKQPVASNGLHLPRLDRTSALFSTNLLPNLKLEEFDAESTHRKFDNITDKLRAAKVRRQEIFKMKMLLDIAHRANQRDGQAKGAKLNMGRHAS